jgi:hypothetical protein
MDFYDLSDMESIKESVLDLIKNLPDDVNFEDILYAIYVREKIEKGLAQADEGLIISHKEVKDRMKKWLK